MEVFEHMMMLIIRTIETNTSRVANGEQDFAISEDEARQFMKKRKSGAALTRRMTLGAGEIHGEMQASDFIAAMDRAKQRLLDSLKKVGIFAALDDDQLILLRDSMVEAPFGKKDMVFEQGDIGDAFYVILEGSFEVLISAGEGKGEAVVGELVEGEFFGERALLEMKPRAASIRCKTKARTMAITRDQFELALGAPLVDLLPVLQESAQARDQVDTDGDK